MTCIMPNHWDLLDNCDSHFTATVRRIGRGEGAGTGEWTPAIDIFESSDEVVIIADVAGVAPEKIAVSAEKGVLTIGGERPGNDREEMAAANAIRIERKTGAFKRAFRLSDALDLDGISARCEHGVLEIRLPKRAELQPRSIPVTH